MRRIIEITDDSGARASILADEIVMVQHQLPVEYDEKTKKQKIILGDSGRTVIWLRNTQSISLGGDHYAAITNAMKQEA